MEMLRHLEGLVKMNTAVVTGALGSLNGLGGDDPQDWDPGYIRDTLPLMSTAINTYFRGDVRGLENVPDGASLLVGNHSGGIYIADTFVLAVEFYKHFGPDRRFHQLAHDLAARNPLLSTLRKYGTLAASHENAERAFALDAPLLVYPGGDYDSFRPTWRSGEVDFGGRKGFIRLALEQNVPIVPVVAVGGQETALFVTRGQRAARALGLDRAARLKVLPVSIGPPFGINLLDLPGRVPLPAKITLQICPPIDVRDRFGANPDPDEVYDEVLGEMQSTLDDLDAERILPLVG
jgi:1-acyl-sn-glycerol-3-phosphate acyltransferase